MRVFPDEWLGINYVQRHECDFECVTVKETEETDAIVAIMPHDHTFDMYVNTVRDYNISIVYSEEGEHYYPKLNITNLKKYFNATSTFDILRSDIPNTFSANMLEAAKISLNEDAKPKAVFIAFNCEAKIPREAMVEEISEEIEVVSPGSCLKNSPWPFHRGSPASKTELMRMYKFYLAFENGIAPGYVTEKVFDAFAAGVLPVYYGTSEVVHYLPAGSYVDVRNFSSGREVGKYLQKLANNQELYESYFAWKNKPLDKEYVERMAPLWNQSVWCRMCEYVRSVKTSRNQNLSRLMSETNLNTLHVYIAGEDYLVTTRLETNFVYILSIVAMIMLAIKVFKGMG